MSLAVNQCYASRGGFSPGAIETSAMTAGPPVLRFVHPLPYGAIVHDGGVQFVVFSRSATAMRVLLYAKTSDPEPAEIVDFDPELNRWGDIWSVFVPGVGPGQLYHFQADGPHEPERGQRFDPQARLIDPYAKALAGCFLPAEGGIIRPPKCVVDNDEFDWQGDRSLRHHLSETVIYELHVRGFTRARASGVKHPGTYAGVIEKIPYLQSLGITAVELMPVHEFPIRDCIGQKPDRPNYWGYDPLAFFAPHRGYAVGDEPGGQVRQFKEMVRALHQAGIEVILDVVFNHTAEGNEYGPTLSFKGLENRVYYMLENGGRNYRNYSGCGNTLNGNHPIVREMIFHCLRHWVHSYHVDGFRFDLASILSRDREGNLIPNPPVVEAIAEDPLLADTKIIAEAWDAAGAYQVGTFANLRWAEWNGRYRDDLRRFWRGDPRMVSSLATRLAGSSDLYQPSGRRPYHSINFITSHDGFTLNDLVSHNQKHNQANGEGNCDGENNNFSDNYGVEGPTRRKAIQHVRVRQIKNMLASLFLSQGVPMMLAGDECRRTQRGNNNAYCQDNAISWFDWARAERHEDLRRFCRALIAFRRAEPTVRQPDFLDGGVVRPGGLPDASWYNTAGEPVDWSEDSPSLTYVLAAWPPRSPLEPPNRHVLMMFHAGAEPQRFTIPPLVRSLAWRQLIDTAADSPADVYPELDGPAPPSDGLVELQARSLVCYVARDEL
jgi:isoamylase